KNPIAVIPKIDQNEIPKPNSPPRRRLGSNPTISEERRKALYHRLNLSKPSKQAQLFHWWLLAKRKEWGELG
ncbi:hypothetical protein Prudu_022817, partial [Prunus dulcis]